MAARCRRVLSLSEREMTNDDNVRWISSVTPDRVGIGMVVADKIGQHRIFGLCVSLLCFPGHLSATYLLESRVLPYR